jgi:hypothetical protein
MAELLAGQVPNLHRRAVSLEQLRAHPRFQGLPPPELLALPPDSPAARRFVRQSSPLWRAHHAGVLTTGVLSGALGFYEEAAAKQLGLPHGRASHQRLLDAWARLCEAPCAPAVGSTPASAPAGPAPSAAEAEARIARAVEAFNAAGAAEAPGAAPEAAPAPAAGAPAPAAGAPPPGSSKSQKRRAARRRRQLAAGGGAASAAAAATPDDGSGDDAAAAWRPSAARARSEEDKLRLARAAAQTGPAGVCCAWGVAQEGAALAALLAAQPAAALAEVGLCMLDAAALPREWGFAAGGALPPIGASPDALLLRAAPGAGADFGGACLLQVFSAAAAADGAAAANGAAAAAAPPRREVVEVKNACAFSLAARRHGAGSCRFVVADRGPAERPDAAWVAQSQMHMLCTSSRSALLLHRSATRGLRAWRLPRDDELCRLMLAVVSALYVGYVAPRRPPPREPFARLPAHAALIAKVRRAAANAEVALELDGAALAALEGGAARDQRFFLA